MSGIRNGTRLEQLLTLHLRTRHEIASATRREAQGELARLRPLLARVEEEIVAEGGTVPQPGRPGPVQLRTRSRKAEDRVGKRLQQLGVTTHDVRAWAVSVGLLTEVRRGRIKGSLVEAYATAHAPGGTAAADVEGGAA